MGASEKTQLRWRYYESSGDISYDTCSVDRHNEHSNLDAIGKLYQEEKKMCMGALQHKVEDLHSRFENVERLVLSHREASSRVLGRIAESEQTCERLFRLLRQKIATIVQKPLNPYRRNGRPDVSDTLFDFSCAGSMKACVDCTIGEFETACCAVRGIDTRTYFRADGSTFVPSSGCLHGSVTVAEMLFDSLRGLCEFIGITQHEDICNIARQEKRMGKNVGSEDAAVRFAGSFLVDPATDESPCCILVCRSIHDGISRNEFMDVVTRDSRDLDPRTLWYKHPFRGEKMMISSLLRYVYRSLPTSASTSVDDEVDASVANGTGCFAVRWKPLANANTKLWTRNMVNPLQSAGSLEVEIPYVLIRGSRGTREINDIVTEAYIKELLS